MLFLTVLPHNGLVRAFNRRWGYRGFDAEAHHYQFTCETICFLIERAGYSVVSVHAPLPHPLERGFRALRSASPRLYIEARPDERAEKIALTAESRNRP